MGDLFSHPSEESKSRFDQSGWFPSSSGDTVQTRSVAVPRGGVYRVSVCAPDAKALFGQRRNLICQDPGREEISFLTHLTEYIPSMHSRANTDLRLFASAVDSEISILRAQECEARTVFIAGDSTVADQYASAAYCPFDSYCGWGQMLPAFLKDDAVCNMAHSGLTSRCFIEDGHFDIVKAHMKRGDLCLIQFGHNDQKRRYLQADKQYKTWLSRICREVISLGGQPVLLSPISRVPGRDEAGCFDLLEAHARAVEALAGETDLPFIDLHAYSFELFCSMGDSCRALFRDMTHSNDPGAFKMAGFIAGELGRLGLAKEYLAGEGFIQKNRALSNEKPKAAPLPVSYVDINSVEDPRVVDQGVQRGLLDPCVLHMHPFEPVTRAAFIQMLFRAAHIGAEATNGVDPYPDVDAREFDAGFAAACKKRGLIDGGLYRPDDPVSGAEINDICRRAGVDLHTEEAGIISKYALVKLLLRLDQAK